MSGKWVEEGRLDRRTFLKMGGALGGALVGLSVLGCQSAAPAASKSQKQVYTSKMGATAMLSSVIYLPILVGEELGYFAKQGIKHQFTEFKGGAETTRALSSGAVDYISTSPPAALTPIMKGESFKIIGGGWDAATTAVWVVKKDSPLQSLKDIKGKKVSFSSPGSLTDFFTRLAVKKAGLTESEVNRVPVGSDADSWTATKTGIVDVGWTSDVIAAKAVLDGEGRILFTPSQLASSWEDGCVVTTEKFLKEKPEVLRGFLTAYEQAEEYMDGHRQEAAQIWHKYNADISADLAMADLKAVPKEAFSVKLLVGGLRLTEQAMHDMNLIKTRIPWDKIIDQQFLPENLRIDVSKLTA